MNFEKSAQDPVADDVKAAYQAGCQYPGSIVTGRSGSACDVGGWTGPIELGSLDDN
jgi:hypothetical protein